MLAGEKTILLCRKLEKGSRFLGGVFYILIVTLGFLVILELSLFVSISANHYLIVAILLYTMAIPFLALLRRSFTYLMIVPIPYLGSWIISIIYLSSFAIPIILGSAIVSSISIILPTLIHFFSRQRSMIRRLTMTSVSRTAMGFFSAIFFGLAIIILGPTVMESNVLNNTIYYIILLFAYAASGMIHINFAYRYRLVCRKINENRIEQKVSSIFKKIRKRFSDKEKDVDLLRYYLEDALNSFEEGNYENAFLSGYKIINEPTVVNPKEYVTDKREDFPSSFSDIRTILMHSRRRELEIDVKRIRLTKSKLFQYSLELLQRDFDFLEKISQKE